MEQLNYEILLPQAEGNTVTAKTIYSNIPF